MSSIEAGSMSGVQPGARETAANQAAENEEVTKDQSVINSRYAKYVLAVMVLVYGFNVIDRQIFSILAESIKADLGLSDADLGFLGGAAFAVFYAIFGLPLARLADVWNRKKLIAIGLGFWSLMTVLSGTARGLVSMAFCRFGVGVGEASASPSIYSMLYDYFSPKVRATVVAVYASGLYIGAGLGLFLGGVILDSWNQAFPDPALAPFGFKGWQAAFVAVGLPGLLMAVWVWTLREPARGLSDGIVTEPHPHPFRETFIVLMSLLPLTNLWVLKQEGGSKKDLLLNLLVALGIALVVAGLVALTGDAFQWVVLGLGFYAVASWAQSLVLRDPVVFGVIFKCKALVYAIFSQVGPNFMGIAIGLWSVPYMQRYYGVSATEVGTLFGIGYVVMGMPGALLGGILADKARSITPRGKLYVLLFSNTLSTLAAVLFLTVKDVNMAYVCVYVMYFAGAMGFGPGGSTVNDLVLPRIRATVTAFSVMTITLIAYAMGPYIIGQISDGLIATGVETGEALRQGMLWSLLMAVAGITFMLLAIKHIEHDEASLRDRAKALGEKI